MIKQHIKRKATAKVNIGTKLLKKLKTFPLKHIWTKSLFSVNKRFYSGMYEGKLSRNIKFCFEPVRKKNRLDEKVFRTTLGPLQDPEKVC